MVWQFPQSGSSALNLNSNDDVFIAQQVFLSKRIFAYYEGHDIVVAGTVATGDETAIMLGTSDYLGTTGANSVRVEATAQVRTFGESTIMLYGFDQKVTNFGLITQYGPADAGMAAVYFRCLSSAGEGSSFTNSGKVEAVGYGVYNHGSQVPVHLINSGTIEGGLKSYISVDVSVDTISNSGRMIGDISLGSGADLYDGRLGTVTGDVFGEAGEDRLYAGSGNNRLFGGDDRDTLMGGAGADYLSGGTGADTASYVSATAAVKVSLASPAINTGDAKGDTFDSIESLMGSNYNDSLFGNSTANAINGGTGDDLIKGYTGNDALTGGAGKDTFNFDTALNAQTNVDSITDFRAADDTIQLENAIFKALTATGTLTTEAFWANTTGLAHDASDRIIYETDTGFLYYDANGTGSGAGILFAKLTPGLTLSAADFFVV